jgi:hypothetical protein
VEGIEELNFFLWPYYNIRRCMDLKFCVVIMHLVQVTYFCKDKKGEVVLALTMKTYKACRGRRVLASLILNLITVWRSVVKFMHWLVYSQGRTQVPTDKEDGWAPKLIWLFLEEEKNFLPLLG